MTKTLLTALLFSSLATTSALADTRLPEPSYFSHATRGYPSKEATKVITKKPTNTKRIPDPLYFKFAKGNG